MEAIEALMTRHSAREFSSKPVSKKDIEEILKAAMQAPSARDSRPWHFIAIQERKMLDKLPEGLPYAQMCKTAQAAILVCAKLDEEKSPGYWPQDCSNAAMSILLAAHAKGLGAVWTAIYNKEDRLKFAKEVFSLPENVMPLCLIPLGYAAKKESPKNKFDEKKMHWEKW